MKRIVRKILKRSGIPVIKNRIPKSFLPDALAAVDARDIRIEDEIECRYRSKVFHIPFYAEGRVVIDTEREDSTVSDLKIFLLKDKDRKFDLKKEQVIERSVYYLIEQQMGEKALEEWQTETKELLDTEIKE